ncbi:MAG: class I tRNA ligase family protein [Bdellovibrio sp.]|nr:class I tRNA ligase family protein [Bdellovibrio sp.]
MKFFHLQLEEAQGGPVAEPEGGVEQWLVAHKNELLIQNRWILSRLQRVTDSVENGLQAFELNISTQAVYEFSWHEFCDWYIEFAKLPLREGGGNRLQTLYTLQFVLERLMRLMHPFMPFVTEELWQTLPWVPEGAEVQHRTGGSSQKTLMLRKFPEFNKTWLHDESERVVDELREIIQSLRNFKGENNLSPKTEFDVFFRNESKSARLLIEKYCSLLGTLAKIKGFQPWVGEVREDETGPGHAVILLTRPQLELRIPLEGLVDIEGEVKRLEKEIEKFSEELAFIRNKLSKESFVAKAPAALVEKERTREKELVAKTEELAASLKRLKRK